MVDKVTNEQLQRKVEGLENEIDTLRLAMAELATALAEMAIPEDQEDAATPAPPGKVPGFEPEQDRNLPPLYG